MLKILFRVFILSVLYQILSMKIQMLAKTVNYRKAKTSAGSQSLLSNPGWLRAAEPYTYRILVSC